MRKTLAHFSAVLALTTACASSAVERAPDSIDSWRNTMESIWDSGRALGALRPETLARCENSLRSARSHALPAWAVACNLDLCARYVDDVQRRLEMLSESEQLRRRSYGEHDPRVADSLRLEADALEALGDLDRAQELRKAALSILSDAFGSSGCETVPVRIPLALGYARQHKPDRAEQLLRESVAICPLTVTRWQREGPDGPSYTAITSLIGYLRGSGRVGEADRLQASLVQVTGVPGSAGEVRAFSRSPIPCRAFNSGGD